MRLTTTRRAPRSGRAALLLAAALSGVLALSACGGDAEGDDADENTIHIVGFAVPEAANKNIATEFQKTDAGEDVSSRRRTAPPATRAARSPPASRPTTCTSPCRPT